MTKKILSFLTSLLLCLLIIFPAFGVNGCKHLYDNSGSISSKTLNELEKKADKTEEYLSVSGNTKDTAVSSLIPKDRQKPLVVDEADILSPQEEHALLEKLEDYSEELKCEIAIVAVNSTQGKTAQEFADDFYDYYGYGYGDNDDGMLFLISMGDRKWAVSTFGEAYNRMYIDDINGMVSAAKKYLSANRFADAFDVIADKAYTILSEGGSVYENNEKSTVSWTWIPIDIVIGFIIAFIIVKIQSSSLKSVRSQTDADNYVVPGSVVITHNSDRFLYKNVSRTKRVEESSSGGSGGSHGGHISSSGRTHGGSSGSF